MGKVIQGELKSKDKKFGIVVSRFNEFITKKLLDGCLDELNRLGVKSNEVTVCFVPGSFEIPVVALKLAKKSSIDAVICIGSIIRGETIHFELVAKGAADGIAKVAIISGKPIIFCVLATETLNQAYKRAGVKGENKGKEAARDAVEMVSLLGKITHA